MPNFDPKRSALGHRHLGTSGPSARTSRLLTAAPAMEITGPGARAAPANVCETFMYGGYMVVVRMEGRENCSNRTVAPLRGVGMHSLLREKRGPAMRGAGLRSPRRYLTRPNPSTSCYCSPETSIGPKRQSSPVRWYHITRHYILS